MERLTDPAQGYCEMYCKKYGRCFGDPGDCIFEKEKEIYQKLKDIEGIVSFDRLVELAFADRDGRCVVLPCKDGDKLRRDGTEFTADHWNLILTAFAEDKSTKSGKRVGLFGAKEAEAALKASDVT